MKYAFQEIKKRITNSLYDVIDDKNIEIKLEKPSNEKMGDFAFPCFQLAPKFKKSPKKIAEEIASNIEKQDFLKKIEAKNGYINFFLNEKIISSRIIEDVFKRIEKYGELKNKNKKVIIEHTSANPNGPLHVGRARNPIIGDTIVRIFRSAGYNVESQFYLDDMGKQVAILAWGLNNLEKEEIIKPERTKPDHETVGFYQKANELLEENIDINEEIQTIIKKSEEGDKKIIELLQKSYTPVLKGMKESLKKINIEIEKYIPESNFLHDESVNEVVSKLKGSKFSDKEDGAYFIDMEPFGIKGRNTNFYFLRKDGTTLYATRDIAYHLWKAKNADLLINILGEDHKLESKQVETALKIVGAKKIPNVIFYSFVSLPGGKMSTRKNRVVYLDDLIDESINRAYGEVKKRRGHELTEEKMKKIAETIGVGAIRYNIIKVQPEKSIVFKWEEALNFEGNSAPFIQYSYARAAGIIKKYGKKIELNNKIKITHESEAKLIKKIGELPEIIKQSSREFKPHLISFYLYELASQFNQFYRDCPVISETDKEIKETRLKIVNATKIAIRNGLGILGIDTLEEM